MTLDHSVRRVHGHLSELGEEIGVNHPCNGIELKDAPGYLVDWIETNERGGYRMADWVEPLFTRSSVV